MIGKKFLTLFLFLFFIGLSQSWAQSLAKDESNKDLYARALLEENAKQNPKEALALYTKLYTTLKGPESFRCKVRFRMGVCLKKLGKKEAAKKIFKRLFQNEKAPLVIRAKAGAEVISTVLRIPREPLVISPIDPKAQKKMVKYIKNLTKILGPYADFQRLQTRLKKQINLYISQDKKKKDKLQKQLEKLKRELRAMAQQAKNLLKQVKIKGMKRILKQLNQKRKEFTALLQKLTRQARRQKWQRNLKQFFRELQNIKLPRKFLEEVQKIQQRLESQLGQIKIPQKFQKRLQELQALLQQLQNKAKNPEKVRRQIRFLLRELQRELDRQVRKIRRSNLERQLKKRLSNLNRLLEKFASRPIPKKIQDGMDRLLRELEKIQKLPKSINREKMLKQLKQAIEELKRLPNSNDFSPKKIREFLKYTLQRVQRELKRLQRELQQEVDKLKSQQKNFKKSLKHIRKKIRREIRKNLPKGMKL